ncbi:tripartite tricarboxylate transporter substrate binding protein [Arthrobacter pigmenti]
MSAGGSPESEGNTTNAAPFPGDDPVTVILPYSAGGSSDTLVRALVPYLEDELGTDVLVQNKTGAGGQIGLTELANSEPDGHTIGLTNLPSSLAYLNPDKKAPYDGSDFTPLGTINRFQWVVVTSGNSPWDNLEAFIAAAAKNPGGITVGTDGLTGDDHMAILKFEQLTGTDLKVVPYDSGSEKMTALLGGQIDASFGSFPTFQGQLETGELKALAALEPKPIEGLDGVKTAADQGVDLQWVSYNVMSAPANLPDEVKTTLESAIKSAVETALQDPKFTDPMTNAGFVVEHKSAAETQQTWNDLEKTFKELMPLARGEE